MTGDNCTTDNESKNQTTEYCMSENPTQQLDFDRRRELAREALDTGFDDPLWLHNLSQCLWFQSDAYSYLLETAEQLRHDAELLEMAHHQIDNGDLVPAEAAFYIATNVEFSEFKREYRNTRTDWFDSVPITEEP